MPTFNQRRQPLQELNDAVETQFVTVIRIDTCIPHRTDKRYDRHKLVTVARLYNRTLQETRAHINQWCEANPALAKLSIVTTTAEVTFQ